MFVLKIPSVDVMVDLESSSKKKKGLLQLVDVSTPIIQ